MTSVITLLAFRGCGDEISFKYISLKTSGLNLREGYKVTYHSFQSAVHPCAHQSQSKTQTSILLVVVDSACVCSTVELLWFCKQDISGPSFEQEIHHFLT